MLVFLLVITNKYAEMKLINRFIAFKKTMRWTAALNQCVTAFNLMMLFRNSMYCFLGQNISTIHEKKTKRQTTNSLKRRKLWWRLMVSTDSIPRGGAWTPAEQYKERPSVLRSWAWIQRPGTGDLLLPRFLGLGRVTPQPVGSIVSPISLAPGCPEAPLRDTCQN